MTRDAMEHMESVVARVSPERAEDPRDAGLEALAGFGLDGAPLALLTHTVNATFRVEAGPGQRCVLRLYRQDLYPAEAVRAEVEWLTSLRADGLAVPEPVPAVDGEPFVLLPDRDGAYRCAALFRWIEGRFLEAGDVDAGIAQQLGIFAARLHTSGERFVRNNRFERPVYGLDRLLGDGEPLPAEAEGLLSRRDRDMVREAASLLRTGLAALSPEPEVFGPIHGDLTPKNCLVVDGGVAAIDFADCGWGYYGYDLATTLLRLSELPDGKSLETAFLRGYGALRPLPAGSEDLLQSFKAVRVLYLLRFLARQLDVPQVREQARDGFPWMVSQLGRLLGQRLRGRTAEPGDPSGLTTTQFLAQLQRLDIEVWADGDRLRFSAPAGALTGELKGELARRKLEILGFLRRTAAAAEAGDPPIAPRRLSTAPLSFGQERLWFFDQYEPQSPVYNISQAVHLAGALRVDVLRESVAEVVRRHGALRTRFASDGERPLQIVEPGVEVELPVLDLSGLPSEERQDAADRFLRAEARRPFDLSRAPLLRMVLLRLAEDEHLFLLTVHHIVSDGWSSGLIVRELMTLYESFSRGEPSPLPALPIQYTDYAVWQRERLQGEVLDSQISYWKERLAGAPHLLELPTDRPRPPVQSYEGGKETRHLPAELSVRLAALCRQEGVTPFMALLAAFAGLLHRATSREDFLVGSPIAGRTRAEIEPLIGFFVNTLVLRLQPSGRQTFRDLVEQVRQTTLGAYVHQELPFDKLVEELHPERALSHAPLVQVVFSLLNVPGGAPGQRSSLRTRNVPMESGRIAFDLLVNLREDPDGLYLSLRYRNDLWNGTSMERLASQFQRLLAGAVDDPTLPVAGLPLLSEAETHQVRSEWNDTRSDWPREAPVHRLFEVWAAWAPGAPAITFGGRVWTYQELDAAANRLARHLQAAGIAPGDRVGLALERSPELVVTLLAILKAGGTYVPLDPQLPEDRLAFMLDDTDASLVLVHAATRERLPDLAGRRLLDLDLQSETIQRRSGAVLPDAVPPEAPAYVIYTSGSTGRPKGVLVPHTSIVRLVRQTNFADLSPEQVFLLLAPVSFDASTFEIWGSLLNGARLVIQPPGNTGLEELAETLSREGVTTLWLTAGLFHLMVDERLEAFAGVRQLLAGGDALSLPHVRRVLDGRAVPMLINGYGPTENTTFTCCHPMPDARSLGSSVPIGRPIASTRVHILDRELRPVPIGSPGELCTGGDGLALGYLNRSDLTAERFIPDPLSTDPGERLYRTGDLARYLPDGTIEFLGRFDNQVKIRGFRIELGEIEEALRRVPGVRDSVVVVREDRPGDKRLVAYVVAAEPLDLLDVRNALRRSLPDYMVPADIVPLGELPLTVNGKVDRRALPAPGQSGEERPQAAPRNPTEEILAGIWAEVLGRQRVDVEADFFELGGHSLLATQVMSRIRNAFGVELPLQKMFEAPTVAGLAQAVQAARESQGKPQAPPMVRVPRAGDLPLSFAQQRLWFLDRMAPGSAAYNIPSAMRLSGDLRPDVLAEVFCELVRRHEALRTTFRESAGQPVQVISPSLATAMPVIDLEALAEPLRTAELQRLIDREGELPFDLAMGPLIRFGLVRLTARDHAALVTMHHIVSDGWSVGVFLRELAALYVAFARGERSPLLDLPVQYGDFSVWQRSWLRDDVLAARLDLWRQALAGAPMVLDLPTDRPRPAAQTFRGAVVPVAFSQELSQGLVRLGRREGATLYMTLLAAFQALLARWSGQQDMLLGTPIAGRNRREIEGLIGFFINTLVLRGDVSGDPRFRDLLGRVRSNALEAFALQDLPFERLVEEMSPERDLSRSPLFQVLFVLQNTPDGEARVPGLAFTALRGDHTTAKFDLTLSLQEGQAGISGSLEYNTDLFDAATVLRLACRFERLLEEIVADPARPLSGLEWLGEAERHQVQVEWNDTEPVWEADACLHDLFAAQAARTPEAVALVHGEERLSYAELDRRSNQLAHHLRALGVGPEDRVGICAERGLDLVVGLLGILKAGGVYVPLDPAYPAERLAFMLEDAGGRVLVTQESLVPRLPEGTWRAVLLDGHREEIAGLGTAAPEPVTGPDGLAYLIYTSGSTGRPKAVSIEHRSAVALVFWARQVFGPEELSGVLASTSISFDLSVFELFVPLAWGGTVILAANALALPELPSADDVRMINTVPSAMAELLRLEAVPAGVRSVNLAGEPLTGALAGKIHGSTDARLFNLYGPSEDTTYSTFAQIEAGEAHPSIGRPLSASRAYVLDRHRSPVGVGGIGELHLAGAGLARGYLGRPETTAGSFVPDPFGGPGERLYRTGDLVRLLTDGRLHFLGRIDHQVKVRGFRIELGEIEAALLRLPEVEDAVIVVREDLPGDRRIAAYVAAGEDVISASLRESLRRTLPEHMVPSSFTVLPALPRTPNGKVDRKALPVPHAAGGEAGPAPASDPVGEVLAGIWAEVLGLEHVGPDDHFFELGGHSLLATQVVSRVRETLAVELPLQGLFASPRLSDLAARVREEDRRERGLEVPPVTPAVREGDLPLSFAQQRLWFLDRFEPGSSTYNMPFAVQLTGLLDPTLLDRALQEVVRRHESLRTTFAEIAGRPVQVIVPELALPFPVVDLSMLAEEAGTAASLAIATEEARQPFDLAAGPLLRTRLLRLGAEDHLLLLTMHHIISDGWSVGIFLRELGALYGAFASGEPSPLAPLPVQYADFACWQRSWLSDDVLATRLGLWRQALAGAPTVLELPTDRPHPPVQSFRGAVVPVVLSQELSHELVRLGRREGATLYMTLLAAFQALLARWSGQDDMLLGTPIAGRNRREIEGLIGFFVNTLVLRGDVSGDPRFRDLLGRVRSNALEAFAHQDLPFERLVEEMAPERDLSRSPLFQVLFALQNTPAGEARVPGLVFTALGGEHTTAKFDLTMSLQEGEEGISGSFEYNTDLFDTATLQRLAGRFERLLEAIVADPAQTLSGPEWLGEAERHQVQVEWNDTVPSWAAQACLHDLVSAQAARTPEAVALVDGEERLTYAELDRRSNQLAHHLRALGVAAEDRVGICAERGLHLVVGLLGILKAGGVYVPLDPAYPADRLAFMLEDAGGWVLVTQESLVPRLPEGGWRAVLLDSHREKIAGYSIAAPEPVTGPDGLAYLIYTSGSTGRPKAVSIEHRSAVALVLWARQVFGPEDLAGVLAGTSISFDLSVFELFVPLAWGGTVILAANALALPELPAANEVRLINTVPSAIAELLRLEAVPAGVRSVNLAGEPLTGALAGKIHASTEARLFNLYGPSEDTTYSTFAQIEPGEAHPSIGRPLSGSRAYVLDRHRSPVGIGGIGELYLAGEGLARGYLGRPETTSGSFVPDPFGGPGERLYRTGDLVRLLTDGRLHFLGRIDHQVKVRGFRIELGEIEAALLRLPEVEDAVVVVREDLPGDRRIAAYVATGEAAPATLSLRESLRRTLPEHMVPLSFTVLPALPRTPNGKVDRKALPAPHAVGGEAGPAPASDPVGEVLAGIWSEVLGLEQVGPNDNFFELGGHSLLATQVVSRVRETLGVELPLQGLFAAPRLSDLAARVREEDRRERGLEVPPVTPAVREGHLPLSFGQQRLWFLDRFEPGSSAYNMPFAVRLKGLLDPALLNRALQEIVRRHESLRTTFTEVDGRPVQVIAPELVLPFPVVDLFMLPEEAGAAAALAATAEEARQPFDLATGPLMRVRLLRLGAENHLLLLTLHHIISDGWSINLLFRELTAAYVALAQGDEPDLPPLPVQYADFAAWQRRWLSGEVLDAQMAYWRQQLAGIPPSLELPTDRPRPAMQTSRGSSVPLDLPAGVTAALARIGRRCGGTLFMTLLAAFQALLARYTGQRDLVVGSPIAGRTRQEIEPLIGLFVNTLVLRTDLSGDPSFAESLARVRRTALDAYAHQDIPFERLVEELAPERDLSRTPLFQVLFVLQHAPQRGMDLGEVQLVPWEVESRTAKFDLTLGLAEDGGGAVSGVLEYNTDLFDRATIARMAGHLRSLLEALADRGDGVRLSELPLVSEAERHLFGVEWNDTAAFAPAGGPCLHRLVKAQVERTPRDTALIVGERSWTYAEFDARANRLAHRLRSLGVGPEVPVALCARRSADLITAILGILKAGGAYVPLDPAYPQDRLEFMLSDTCAPVILTETSLLDRIPAGDARVIRLDVEEEAFPQGPEGCPESGVGPENLAYFIYTSGSTGRPKGVAIEHRSAAVLVRWSHQVFGEDECAGVLAATSICFDLSIYEIFVPLARGGCVILADDALALPNLPAAGAVTLVNTVPSVMTELIRSGGLPAGVKTVNLAGEALPARLAEDLYALGTVERLFNLYGPSEDTTYSTGVLVPRTLTRAPSIGRPIADTRGWLLDPDLQPVPIGVRGELYLGGMGLARCYFQRPELTADRFRPDPFSKVPGARLYRTGDVARLLPDGLLEYLGRTDHQVKIRGFRVELGEVEDALRRHPGVRESVVIIQKGEAGSRLVAYYATDDPDALPVEELRRSLGEKLPGYMVPSVFILLDRLPLTPNGKVDRKALPAPDAAQRPVAGAFVAPRTSVELELQAIWEEVLGVHPIGVTDSFFHLGGHSLAGIYLMACVRERLGRQLPVALLFQAPTIEGLAAILHQDLPQTEHPFLIPLQPRGGKRPFFCVHGAGGNVFRFAHLSTHLGRLDGDRPVYGLQARGLMNDGEPLRHVEEMAALYLEAVRKVQPSGPYLLGGYSMGGLVAYEIARQLRELGEEVAVLAMLDALADQGVHRDAFNQAGLLSFFAHELLIPVSPSELTEIPESEQLAFVLQRGWALGKIPKEFSVLDAERYIAVLETSFEATRLYRREFSYDRRIVVFKGDDSFDAAEDLGWAAAAPEVESHIVPGGHRTMFESPNVEVLSNALKESFDRYDP